MHGQLNIKFFKEIIIYDKYHRFGLPPVLEGTGVFGFIQTRCYKGLKGTETVRSEQFYVITFRSAVTSSRLSDVTADT